MIARPSHSLRIRVLITEDETFRMNESSDPGEYAVRLNVGHFAARANILISFPDFGCLQASTVCVRRRTSHHRRHHP